MKSPAEIAAAVRSGEISPLELVEEALSAIEAQEEALDAWVAVDVGGARRTALEMVLQTQTGALAGVPVGIKDIYEVAGLPTALGAGDYARHDSTEDGTAVKRLRAAGAIILGKTATTEFAFLDATTTRNPWNLEHSPGGSSSGSAAAVAAGMVPITLGSQTVGSVLRPASYCGVVGLKPTHGRIGTAGVFPLAPSFDHVGIFARSVADAALVLSVLAGPEADDPSAVEAGIEDYVAAATGSSSPPVIGMPWRFIQEVADREVSEHIEQVAATLSAAGARILDVEMPMGAREIAALGLPILRAEAATVHQESLGQNPDAYRPHIKGLVEAGIGTSAVEYIRAQEDRADLRASLLGLLGGFEVLLLPAAPSTAPRGLDSTGDSVFCAPASFTGLPSIALPTGLSGARLPLGIQLVAPSFGEAALLRVAAWIERAVEFNELPPAASKPDGA